ncbi:GntR family transcriptional regulator [Planococcus sp. YIM B11945]|uniref:GntR family transcriptional regulator n=1 Tax=Planococcus sp. YIM B11945 TaxID=3435410 RepID=UPI003D7EE679
MKLKNFLTFEHSYAYSLPEQVANAIRVAIFKGDLKPGDRIVQDEIANSLSISRMPVREALQKLNAEGLIEIKPNRGAVVKQISLSDITDTYQLRVILEKVAVKESLPKLTAMDKIEIESLVKKMELADDPEDYTFLNKQFHQNLMKHCSNQKMMKIIEGLWAGFSPYTPYIIDEQMSNSNNDHTKIVIALKEDNFEEIHALIETHILSTEKSLMKYLRDNEIVSVDN